MDKLKKIAINLDSNDELSSYRKEFILPTNTIYLDGNSLGVLSKNIINDINNTIKEDWGNNLISSWNDKWIELPNKVSKKIASILNCSGNEVYVGSSTSNNLYKLIKSILEAHKDIKNISTDNLNFPSDKYICEGICEDFNLKFKFLLLSHERIDIKNKNFIYKCSDLNNKILRFLWSNIYISLYLRKIRPSVYWSTCHRYLFFL